MVSELDPTGFLKEVFALNRDRPAFIFKGEPWSYGNLLDRIGYWEARLVERGLAAGRVAALEGDFSPESVALLLAMTARSVVIVPLLRGIRPEIRERYFAIAEVEEWFRVEADESVEAGFRRVEGRHAFYSEIERRGVPGLVLFTSGSSGAPKAAVHDFSLLLMGFHNRKKGLRTLNFLKFDHWGGLNTLLHILASGGTVVPVPDNSPGTVCRLIERHGIQLLPVSPTFLNLMILSKAHARHDLSSLEVISYGAEPMPPNTLKRLKEIFPAVRLKQTYGLIELGVLASRSKSDDSLWVKVGGEGYETRIVDGILQIKARSAMLGYLNAPSPFTHDGWFVTGDAVEVDGEYVKFLGRKSEIIMVGAEKVYPAEVENAIQAMDQVLDVRVSGKRSPITGSFVVAEVLLANDEPRAEFFRRLKFHCRKTLQEYKIPVAVTIVKGRLHGDRFKKLRESSQPP